MVNIPGEEAVGHPVELVLVLTVHYQDRLMTVTLEERDSPFEAVGSNHGVDDGAILVVVKAQK